MTNRHHMRATLVILFVLSLIGFGPVAPQSDAHAASPQGSALNWVSLPFISKPQPTRNPHPTRTPVATVTPLRTSTAVPTLTAIPSSSPQPSATASTTGVCAESVHARYTATGPDGNSYHTWHPQRDPSGCYFQHDHGSNPGLFAAANLYKPAFGYVGTQAGTDEPHAGFKNFLMDDGQGHHWLFTVHLGSAGAARVCTRFHSVELAIANIASGELLARVHFMGDFGRAEDNRSLLPLTPTNCPRQYDEAIADRSSGMRQLSVNTIGEGQYEPWRFDSQHLVLGLKASGLTFNTLSALTTCDNLNCNTLTPTGHTGAGAFRMLDYQTGLAFVAGTTTGSFTTEPYGRSLGGSVQQYVRPGINVVAQANGPNDHYWPQDANNMLYCMLAGNSTVTASATNIDGKIRPPN